MSDDHATCWYCENPLARRHEHDHVRPQRRGGVVTVPTCLNCHDVKDRMPLLKWPAQHATAALMELARTEHPTLTGIPAEWLESDVIAAIEMAAAGPPRLLAAKLYALKLDQEAARLSAAG